jgi:hypothetical protein
MHIELIQVEGSSNRDFLEKYCAPGRVGLVGGDAIIDRMIRRAERHLNKDKCWSLWSHVFLCGGKRMDDQHWIFESDIQANGRHLAFGVQENPISKYFDETSYPCLGLIDFQLSDSQLRKVLSEALGLLAARTNYSIRELIGTAMALRKADLRTEKNRLARKQSIYCSAFVQQVYKSAGLELLPGLNVKQSTPEDLARSPLPHTFYQLSRQTRPRLAERIRAAVKGKTKL